MALDEVAVRDKREPLEFHGIRHKSKYFSYTLQITPGCWK